MEDQQQNIDNKEIFEIGYEPGSPVVILIDITGFTALVKKCFETTDRKIKQAELKKLLSSNDFFEIHNSKNTGRKVLCETKSIEYAHEEKTVILLAEFGYDVIFAPKGMFKREEKKFDIYLVRDRVILKADLKSVTSKNPDTIANRIKGGSDQASRIVMEICSDIEQKSLIEGLRSGTYKNKLLKEILLIYKKRLYRLPKTLIESKQIYEVIK